MQIIVLSLTLWFIPIIAYAVEIVLDEASTKIDWTPIILAIVSGIFGVIGLVINATISKYLTNKKDREIANNALNNALGTVQGAIEKGIKDHPLLTELPPGTPPEIAAGVQSAINNAGPEMARLGLTEDAVAAKLIDRWNLKTVDNPTVPNKQLNAPLPKPV